MVRSSPMSAFVGVYWGPRKESRLSSAVRLTRFFEKTSEIDPRLREWFLKEAPEEPARTRVELTVESLKKQLHPDRAGHGKRVKEDHGLSFRAWNGAEVSFFCTLGAFTDHAGNRVVMEFDYVAMNVNVEFARAILVVAVEAFEPEFGRVAEYTQDSSPYPEWLAYDRIHGIRAASLGPSGPKRRV